MTSQLQRIQPIVSKAMLSFSSVVSAQVAMIGHLQALTSQMFLLRTEFGELQRIKKAIENQELLNLEQAKYMQ